MMASLSLPSFINPDLTFNFDRLHSVTKTVVFNTDRCIDISDYSSQDMFISAHDTRALGVGVQGLAEVFMRMKLPFTSATSRNLNIDIFETIYHAALEASCDLARQYGPYNAWVGSPASRGILQIDLWGATPSNRHDFAGLRQDISHYGLRNSMLTTLMPAATTSKLLGNIGSFEPYTRCYLYSAVIAGCSHLFIL